MKFKYLFLPAVIFVFAGNLAAQDAGSDNKKASKKEAKEAEKAAKEAEAAADSTKKKRIRPPYASSKWPSISVGAGNMSFMGDIAENTTLFTYTNWRMGYNFRIEHRTFSALGFAINGLYGKIAQNERSRTRNLNIETGVMQAELDIMIYLDNNLFINRASRFTPYLFGGIGYMMFDPRTNLLDKNNKPYYYWDDGTIRTEPKDENTIGHIVPGSPEYNITTIDKTYETKVDASLEGENKKFEKAALTIPVGGGLRYKLSDHFDICASATYYLTLTDYMDATKGKKGLMNGNDEFIYTSLSFAWNIGMSPPKMPSIYDDINFEALDKEDDDGDGIANNEDWCAGTPSGVAVDANGCPFDNDKDGVPDYKDDEPNSALGAIVDLKGVTIGEDSYDDLGADTLGTPRNLVLESHPKSKPERVGTYFSFEKPAGSSSNAAGIAQFAEVDLDGDGFISPQEITIAIDKFFDGELNYSASKLHELIDFFFEQE